jgi:hypothetical protein
MFPHCYFLCVSMYDTHTCSGPPHVNPSTSLGLPYRLTPCAYLWLSELEQPSLEDLEAVLQEVLVLGCVDDLDVVADLRHERQLCLHIWRKGDQNFGQHPKGAGATYVLRDSKARKPAIQPLKDCARVCTKAFLNERASAFWLSSASGGSVPSLKEASWLTKAP